MKWWCPRYTSRKQWSSVKSIFSWAQGSVLQFLVFEKFYANKVAKIRNNYWSPSVCQVVCYMYYLILTITSEVGIIFLCYSRDHWNHRLYCWNWYLDLIFHSFCWELTSLESHCLSFHLLHLSLWICLILGSLEWWCYYYKHYIVLSARWHCPCVFKTLWASYCYYLFYRWENWGIEIRNLNQIIP